MPAERYFISADHRLVLLPCVAEFDWDAWATTMSAIFADARFQPGMCFLSDGRQMRVPYSGNTVERVIRFFAEHRVETHESPWATVTARADALHEMIRVIAPLLGPSGVRLRAFSELGPALDWVAPKAGPEERSHYQAWLERNSFR